MMNRCREQGIGRHKIDDVAEMCRNSLLALSTYLGDKSFLTGDAPTKLDASAFGNLCQLYYVPQCFDSKAFMDEKTQNLVDYLLRLRSSYWPDWDDATSTLSLETNWKDEKYKMKSKKMK